MPETLSAADFARRYGGGAPAPPSGPVTLSAEDFAKRYTVADKARAQLASQGLTPEQVKAGEGMTQPEDIKFDPAKGPGLMSGVGHSFDWLAHPLDTLDASLESASNLTVMGSREPKLSDMGPILGYPGAVADTAVEASRRGAANESTADMTGNALGAAGQAALGKFVVPKVAGFVAEKAPAAVAAVKTAAGAARTALGETAPAKVMNALAKPDLKLFNFGAEPGKGAAGITANSLEGLQTKVNAKIGELHGRLMQDLDTPAAQTKTIDAQAAIAGPIQRAIAVARSTGNTALETRLKALGEAQLGEVGKRFLTPAEAQARKMAIKDLVRWSPDPTEGSVNAALQDMYRQIDRQIDVAVPSSSLLNKQMANLITYEKAIDKRINVDLRTHPASALNPMNVARSTPVQSRLAAGMAKMAPTPEPLPPTVPTTSTPLTGRPMFNQFIDDYIRRQQSNQ